MEKSKVVAVVGADGKMGKEICEKLSGVFEIVKVTEKNPIENLKDQNIDLVIDFSVPNQSVVSANFCKEKQIPLILGTTGHTQEQLEKLKLISKQTKIVMSSNFSVGIFIIKLLLEKLGTLLSNQNCNITIIEKHHKDKLDSPSGTSIMLKKKIEKKFANNKFTLCTLSERGGKEIGTHKIDIYFGNELISLSHKAFSREAFSDGVFITAKSLLGF